MHSSIQLLIHYLLTLTTEILIFPHYLYKLLKAVISKYMNR